jgi:hypothetical protein
MLQVLLVLLNGVLIPFHFDDNSFRSFIFKLVFMSVYGHNSKSGTNGSIIFGSVFNFEF